jgi:hypothetical protein
MFLGLPTVCIVLYVTAKYIRINSVNRPNLTIFLMRAECVLCKTETKYLYVIYANVVLRDVMITDIFLLLVAPVYVCSGSFPDVQPSRSQPRSVSVKIWHRVL